MRKTFKKVMCAVMVAALALSAPVVGVKTTVSHAEEEGTLLSGVNSWTDWVNPDKAKISDPYDVLNGQNTVIYIKGNTGNDDIALQVTDGTNYFTNETQGGSWGFENRSAADERELKAGEGVIQTPVVNNKGLNGCEATEGATNPKEKHVLQVTTTMASNATEPAKKDITINITDTETQKSFITYKAVGMQMADAARIEIFSIWGGVRVYGLTAPAGTTAVDPNQAAAQDQAALQQQNPEPTPTVDQQAGGTEEAAQKSMKISSVVAKKNAKQITGKLSVTKATVKIKVGSKAYKKAIVAGKNFKLKTAKLKKGTKIVIKVTKDGYKSLTKTVKVK